MGQCLLCGGVLNSDRDYIFRTDEFRKIYADDRVYKCQSCELHQIDTSKIDDADLIEYYRYAYRHSAKITSIESEASKLGYTARGIGLLRLAEAHIRCDIRRVFEVGAGYGYNLKVVKDAYPDAAVFTDEIDEDLKETMDSRQASLDDGPFDLIILSHVLEHFIRPQELLQNAIKSLSTGGVIVTEVPNDINGVSSVTWFSDEPHVAFFTTDTFQKMVDTVPEARLETFVITGPTIEMHKGRPTPQATGLKRLVPTPLRRLRRTLMEAVERPQVPKMPDLTTPTVDGIYMRSAITKRSGAEKS